MAGATVKPKIRSKDLTGLKYFDKVQKKLGCSRASLGSLSESATVSHPQRLKEIIFELSEELKPVGRDSRLSDIKLTMTLVDGTLIAALPKLMQASVLKSQTGSGMVKWRLHTHFEVDRYVPSRIDVTRDGGGVDPQELTAMASCESQLTCSTYPLRSSRSSTPSDGPLKSFFDSSSTCSAADIY